jgi:hypothetical protein
MNVLHTHSVRSVWPRVEIGTVEVMIPVRVGGIERAVVEAGA